MAEELPPLRRLITGIGADGKARIIENSPMEGARIPERPGFRMANIWATGETPARVGAENAIGMVAGVHPPKNGTVLRIMDIPPEPKSTAVREEGHGATRQRLFSDAVRNKGDVSKHPGMHMTTTVDYAIVIEGEIIAILEEGEALMRAGDVLIQRGTVHAWANRSEAVCRIAFILIDGALDQT